MTQFTSTFMAQQVQCVPHPPLPSRCFGSLRHLFHVFIGQSFGAFLSKGITLELEGDANDYVGKVGYLLLTVAETRV